MESDVSLFEGHRFFGIFSEDPPSVQRSKFSPFEIVDGRKPSSAMDVSLGSDGLNRLMM